MRFIEEEQTFITPPFFPNGIKRVLDRSIDQTTILAGGEHITFFNASPVTVDTILGGIEGAFLTLLGDGNTTIKHNAGIKTNTGADKLLDSDRLYMFRLIEGIWYEL